MPALKRQICFFWISLRTVEAHPVTNLLLHINCWCISRQTAVNLCSFSTPLFFERSLDRATARRSSPGSQHRPGPHSFTLSSPSSSSVSADYWIYLISFFSSVHLLTFFPSTNTQMRLELDTISSWFQHWLQRNLLPSRINSNVLTQPLKHSTSAEINTAEHCGLKHWIVKVD